VGFGADAIGLLSDASSWVNPWAKGERAAPAVIIPSEKPFLLTQISDRYSHARRNPPHLLWESAGRQRENILDSFPTHQADRYLDTFKEAALVFVPGLLNFFPSDEFFQQVSSMFGHGGVVIGIAAKNAKKSHHGLYSVVGGDERVIQPDWRLELPLLVKRLITALKDPQIEASHAKKFVFVGHSKGGLLLLALQALTQMANEGRLSDLQKARKLFPGLDQIPFSDFRRLLGRLKDSQFYPYGTPVEGIPRTGLVSGFDTMLLQGSARYFTPEFMTQFFKDLGFGPEQATAIIHAQKAQTLKQVLQADTRLDSVIGNAFTTAARALFHGAGHLIGAHKGDGLVDFPTKAWPHLRLLPTPADHLQMVETPLAARALLHVLDDHASTQNMVLPHFEGTVVSAAQALVRGVSELNFHLDWLLEYNAGKALDTRHQINGNLAATLTRDHPNDAESILVQIDELRESGFEPEAQALEVVTANLVDRRLPLFALPAAPLGLGALAMAR